MPFFAFSSGLGCFKFVLPSSRRRKQDWVYTFLSPREDLCVPQAVLLMYSVLSGVSFLKCAVTASCLNSSMTWHHLKLWINKRTLAAVFFSTPNQEIMYATKSKLAVLHLFPSCLGKQHTSFLLEPPFLSSAM